MKVSELLTHITGTMLEDRAALVEGAGDELFKDATVLRYLTEAQKIYCRDAWVLEDLTGPATQISLIEDETDYAFHKSIIHIKSARLSDSALDLTRVGYGDNHLIVGSYQTDPDFWDTNLALQENSGRPGRYSVDMGTRTIRVRQKPDEDSALLKLQLAVVRMPLCDLTKENADKEPEIPEEHHLDLTLFAAGSCLTRTADIDAELKKLGREWLGEFYGNVAKAKRDKQRRQQSMPRFRFGGWGNGGS